jgi:filamentous hemagglutinin family protein
MKRHPQHWGAVALLVAGPVLADDDLCGCLAGNPEVVEGSATCEVIGAATVISLSDNTVIDWDAFTVTSGSELRFDFLDPGHTVVNRVAGPTYVGGSLSSNGHVVVLGLGNTLTFDESSRVTAGSLTVSALDAVPARFFDGSRTIDLDGSAGGVKGARFDGEITTTRGDVVVVGRELDFTADVDAAGGVALLTGDQVTLDRAAPEQSVASGSGQIVQGGSVDAGRDIAFISQNAVSMTGSLRAGGGRGRVFVKVDDGGNILTGAAGLEIRAASAFFSEPPEGEIAFIEPEEGDNPGALSPALNEYPTLSPGRTRRTVPTSSTVVARAGSGFTKAEEEKTRRPRREIAGNVGSVRKRSFFRTRTTVTPKR